VSDSTDFLWPLLIRFLNMPHTYRGDNGDPSEPVDLPDDDYEPARPAREGLPATYRMRADAHYVEALDAPAAAVRDAAISTPRSSAAAGAAPTAVPDIHETQLRAWRDVDACVRLLSPSASTMSLTVGANMIRAQVWRASCLLQASRVVERGVPPGQVLCSARQLVRSVAERAEPDARLCGYALDVEPDIHDKLIVAGDPQVLHTALSGVLLATCAVFEHRAAARVTLTASFDETRQVEFAVSEVGAGVSADWVSRAFDASWAERPGGAAAAVWMLAARTVAEAYGGQLRVSANARGTTVHMIMPVAAA
jgi:signal transduction histidine kinase